MAKRKLTRLRFQYWQIEALEDFLLSETPDADAPLAMDEYAPDPGVSTRYSATSSVQAHLQDEDFIAYSLQTSDAAATKQAELHLQVCDACAAEMERLRHLSRCWSDEAAIERLENRIRAQSRHGRKDRIQDFIRSRGVSLKPLVLPQGAFGEGTGADAISVEFRVTEQDGQPVEGLKGILTRRNREVYLLIKGEDVEDRARFKDREVWITLSDGHDSRPILQRKVDVGVTVLLGTGLHLTEGSELEAQIVPGPT